MGDNYASYMFEFVNAMLRVMQSLTLTLYLGDYFPLITVYFAYVYIQIPTSNPRPNAKGKCVL